MTVKAISCIHDLDLKVQSIAMFRGKTFAVYSEDEIIERTKGISFPCIGLIYNGITALPEIGVTNKSGGSGEVVVSLLVLFRQSTIATASPKEEIIERLDEIRSKILNTRSPTGHLWKFQVEIPVVGKLGVLAYMQRWSTPVQLV